MPGFRQGEILSHLLLFARRLKRKGLKITPGRIVDATRSLPFIDLSRRQDFSSVLKANFVSCREDLTIFEALFDEFWGLVEEKESSLPSTEQSEEREGETPGDEQIYLTEDLRADTGEGGAEERELRSAYSPEEILLGKDFSRVSSEELGTLDREFVRVLSDLATRVSRRREPSTRGREMDFRRTMKKAVRYSGDMVELVRRRKRIKPMKIVFICDVSGSMDASTRFILRFLFGMQKVFQESEFFVFSTRLTRITDLLKRNRWAQVLADISRRVQDWSGGTKIGHCLELFNERYARGMTPGSAVVILISDGWDRGEPELLEGEMKRLKRRSRCLIWLNPLLGNPDYRPFCQGMRTALPYIDYFLSANTLKGWKGLTHALATLSA